MNEKRCSIEGCGDEAYLFEDKPGPYCACHENDYGDEWAWCATGKCYVPVNQSEQSMRCALHGGKDYTPRTKEEGQESSATTASPTPCIVCGVPIAATTRDAGPWAFDGEQGRKEGQVHHGCRAFVEERKSK